MADPGITISYAQGAVTADLASQIANFAEARFNMRPQMYPHTGDVLPSIGCQMLATIITPGSCADDESGIFASELDAIVANYYDRAVFEDKAPLIEIRVSVQPTSEAWDSPV